MQSIPPSNPETANRILLPLQSAFRGTVGLGPQDAAQEGQACTSSPQEARCCTPGTSPCSSRSISLQSSPSALAESLETILPTCMPEPSELFKDTRIFLAAFPRHVAQLMQPVCGCCGGLGDNGVAPTEPQNLLLALQQGPDTVTSPSGTPASRRAQSCAAAAAFWGVLVVGDGARAML